ncbi:TetR family transcriptional regulator [Nocardioides ultimimeridianus]
MGRWSPGAQGRLVDAALDLYAERGFDRTTVAEIAERAGVTERTFFRYFTDKREVLFAGGHQLEVRMTERIAAAEPGSSPLDVATEGLAAAVEAIDRDFALRRHAVVSAHPALQERELLKLDALSRAAAEALQARGIGVLPAALAGESAVAVFKIAFAQWIGDDVPDDLPDLLRRTLAELRSTVAPET